MIQEKDIARLRSAMGFALRSGAQACRLTLSETTSDMVGTLNGEVDKVSHCFDRSVSVCLFVDGKYGAFSTNRLDDMDSFLVTAIGMTRLLSEDAFRKLPARERVCSGAVDGNELALCDSSYVNVSPSDRMDFALKASVWGAEGENFKLVSEEGEYSDSCSDFVVMDSDGTFCRQKETSFEYGVEVTVEDEKGEKYSGYWWTASPFLADFSVAGIGREALRRASSSIGAARVAGGRYNMVVTGDAASRLLSPVLDALNGFSIQQNNSFLCGSLGRRVFSEALTVIDDCHRKGESGSRLFDSEGVATAPVPVIENGTVRRYFLGTYIAGKLGMEPTVDECSRARVCPWPEDGMDRDAVMRKVGRGILVTGFNGGNSNSSTGDFSYGVEGFYFENGTIVTPVSGMLVTGNFIDLFKSVAAIGSDARKCMSRLVPTMAFENVDFIGE